MVIEVKNRKADFSELNINFTHKTPIIDTLHTYWQGSDKEFMDYTRSIELDFINTNPTSLYELHNLANANLEKIQKAFSKQNVGKFDFRIVGAFKSKNMQNFSEDDYLKLTLDLSNYKDEKIKNQIKDIFLSSKSRSLLDFKNVDGDICELYYYKKGLYESNDDIKVVTTRDRITLLENWQEPKDNNFICSGFLLAMAKKMQEVGLNDESFSHIYVVSNGIKKDMTRSINEIVSYDNLTDLQKQEKNEFENLRKEAKDEAIKEIKKENATTRQSLKQDSNDEIIAKSSQVKLSVRDMQEATQINANDIENLDEAIKQSEVKNAKSIEEVIKNSFEFFKQKEREKTEIRLQKAEKEAQDAYFDLKRVLNDGLSILDGINYLKQKYRNEETIHFASMTFAKDILEVKAKDDQIDNLKGIIKEQEKETQNAIEAVEKREKTITELKSTLTKKSNDFNLLKEEFQAEKDSFETQITQKINELKGNYESIIAENNGIIEESQSIIDELNTENDILKNQNSQLSQKVQKLELDLKDSQNSNEKMAIELKFISEKVQNLDNLQKENYELKLENKNLSSLKEQNVKNEAQIKHLSEENRVLKDDKTKNETLISTLQERLRGYEIQVENFMRLLNGQKSVSQSSVNDILGDEPDLDIKRKK